jgi:hypothetical protein
MEFIERLKIHQLISFLKDELSIQSFDLMMNQEI